MRERLKAVLASEKDFFGGIGAKGGFGETDAPPPPPSGPEPEDALTERIRARAAGWKTGRRIASAAWVGSAATQRRPRPCRPIREGPSLFGWRQGHGSLAWPFRLVGPPGQGPRRRCAEAAFLSQAMLDAEERAKAEGKPLPGAEQS